MQFSTYPEDVLSAPKVCFSIVTKNPLYVTNRGTRKVYEYYRPESTSVVSRLIPQMMELDTVHRVLTWFRHSHYYNATQADSDVKWRNFWNKWNVIQYENFPISPLATVFTSPRAFFETYPYATPEVRMDVRRQLERIMGM